MKQDEPITLIAEEQQPTTVAPAPLAAKPRRVRRESLLEDDNAEPGFFDRHRKLLIALTLLISGGLLWSVSKRLSKKSATPPRAQEFTMVKITPLPTPPPPPPPPPQQQEEVKEEMVAQEKVEENQPPPDNAPPAPDLGTNVEGNGPADGFGLSKGTGSQIGGSNRSGSSKRNWYAGQAQSRIREALKSNPKTRSLRFSGLEVRIWLDTTGRITRAKLVGSTGDAKADQALQNEVLAGLQIPSAPPEGIPNPFVLRISGRKPN